MSNEEVIDILKKNESVTVAVDLLDWYSIDDIWETIDAVDKALESQGLVSLYPGSCFNAMRTLFDRKFSEWLQDTFPEYDNRPSRYYVTDPTVIPQGPKSKRHSKYVIQITFNDGRDAMLFKLRWGGAQ